jgi:hypothetical protein
MFAEELPLAAVANLPLLFFYQLRFRAQRPIDRELVRMVNRQ